MGSYGWEMKDVEKYNARRRKARSQASAPVAVQKGIPRQLPAVEQLDEKKTNKLHAESSWDIGYHFSSQKEYRYYQYLKLLLAAGEAEWFCVQPVFILCEGTGKDNRALTWKADFIVKWSNGTVEVVDTKGMETQVFKDKMKVLQTRYPKLRVKKETSI